MSQTRTPQQIQTDIELLQERIAMFKFALAYYAKLPKEEKPNNLDFSDIQLEQFNAITGQVNSIKDIMEKLNANRALNNRMTTLLNSTLASREDAFNAFVEQKSQKDSRLSTEQKAPAFKKTMIIPSSSFLKLHDEMKHNTDLLTNLNNLKDRLRGDPDTLRHPLNTFATNFLTVIEKASNTYTNSTTRTTFLNKVATDLHMGDQADPFHYKSFIAFEQAFMNKYSGKTMHGYDPKLIAIINHWLIYPDGEYQKFQTQLIELQKEKSIHYLEEEKRLAFSDDLQIKLSAQRTKLLADLINWMRQTQDLLSASPVLMRGTNLLIKSTDEEDKLLKEITAKKTEIDTLIANNSHFKLQAEGNIIPASTLFKDIYREEKEQWENKRVAEQETELTIADSLYNSALIKLQEHDLNTDDIDEFFPEKKLELSQMRLATATAIDKLELASNYLAAGNLIPTLTTSVNNYINSAQEELNNAITRIEQIKRAMDDKIVQIDRLIEPLEKSKELPETKSYSSSSSTSTHGFFAESNAATASPEDLLKKIYDELMYLVCCSPHFWKRRWEVASDADRLLRTIPLMKLKQATKDEIVIVNNKSYPYPEPIAKMYKELSQDKFTPLEALNNALATFTIPKKYDMSDKTEEFANIILDLKKLIPTIQSGQVNPQKVTDISNRLIDFKKYITEHYENKKYKKELPEREAILTNYNHHVGSARL